MNALNLLTFEGDFHFHNDYYVWNTNVGKCMHFFTLKPILLGNTYVDFVIDVTFVIMLSVLHLNISFTTIFFSLFINISRETLKAIVHLNHLHQRHHFHGFFRA